MQTKDDTLDCNVPYVVYEAILGRHERIVKRLIGANVVLAAVVVALVRIIGR